MNQLLFGLMRSDGNTLELEVNNVILNIFDRSCQISLVSSGYYRLLLYQDPKGVYLQKHAVVTAISQLRMLL